MCAKEEKDAEEREKGARERCREEAEGEGTRRRMKEGEGTNAVGGSWRRNDYRPRTHSLPAIISSTNATKSIESLNRRSLPLARACMRARANTQIYRARYTDFPPRVCSFTYMQSLHATFKFKCRVLIPRVTCRQKFRIVYILIDIAFLSARANYVSHTY